MRLCFAVCLFVCVTLCPDAYGYLGDDMVETIQLCCNEGAGFARNHTLTDCQGNLSVPPEVRPDFGSMCLMAKAQCCKEYYRKQSDCETGIDIATSTNSCESTRSTSKVCCDDCSRGTTAGASNGPDVCVKRKHGMSAEELLSDDAFVTCCQKAANDWKGDSTSRSSNFITLSTLPSLCEDYAPNELCAHHCIPVPGSYRCECNPGFMLMADGRNCKEVSKNRCKPQNHCQHKCNDNGVEVKCSCRRGYELMPDGTSCQDIDECQLDEHVCLAGTQCYNLQGSYRCISVKKNNVEIGQCPPGFARNLNNHVCDDINECLLPNPPCPAFVCENTVGGYSCGGVTGNPINLSTSPRTHVEDRCPPGFKIGLHEECEDVDECAIHTHDCNLLSQFCINTHSSFYCQDKESTYCPPGFKIDSTTNKCQDIDECEEIPSSHSCRPDQDCINQLGQFDCKPKVDHSKLQCPEGMRKKTGSLYCEDIDECVEGTHLCDLYQNCLNTNGSYECDCKLGYELDVITGACVDINECATRQHDCIPEAQRCDNTVGSYLCIRITPCGTGYVLHHSTGKCEDIDECSIGLHNCGPDYNCKNNRGSFRCVRKRTSTTSTTLPPDYGEYEYYDSDEEIEPNQTAIANKQPKEPSTTTTSTPKPAPPTTASTTTEIPKEPERKIEDNNVEPPPAYNTTSNVYKNEANDPYSKPKYEPPTTTEPEEQTHLIPTEQLEYITVTEPTYTPKLPEVIFNHPTPPSYIPEEELPKQPEEQPASTYRSNGEEQTNESIPPEVEPQQGETTYRPTEEPKPFPLYPVNVNVDNGGRTATDRKEDGSVVVDTQLIPKNHWTNVVKPKECPMGFEADEYGSCFDIDECATNRHSCSGLTEVCRNTIGGYTCNCAPGFRRDLITKSCVFITTTSSTTSTTTEEPQLPTSTKKTFFWGYPEYTGVTTRPFRPRNLCDAGFHHNAKTGECEDINECTNGQANCAAVEICINTPGGYRCECPPNWRLDEVRHRCVPVRNNGQFPTGYGNVPIYPTLPPKNVVHTAGTQYVDPEITQYHDRGSVFRCPAGYRLGDDNTCVDVNECLTGEAKCGPQQICSNLPGGYSCNCPSGHRLIQDHECEDVDECALGGSMPVCSQNADCLNTIGSYQCKCHIGFRSAPVNDKVCVDVDECMESRPGSLCQHRCNNVWGAYRCACHRGYRLNPDNSTCSDVDECTEFKSKIPCVGRCLNEPGSYRCACPTGYRLSEDKRSCIDIDECETGEAPCSKSAGGSITSSDVCVNTRGSYRCQRISCPVGYQLENKHRCNKVERVCQPGDWSCAHQPTTISYNFITFVSNLYIPDTKLKLFTMRGPVWPYVKMRFELKLVNVNAPPSIKRKADINDFLLSQNNNEGLTSLVRPLEGPQSIELEMSMELYTHEQFGGTAIAKLFIYVSEYEF